MYLCNVVGAGCSPGPEKGCITFKKISKKNSPPSNGINRTENPPILKNFGGGSQRERESEREQREDEVLVVEGVVDVFGSFLIFIVVKNRVEGHVLIVVQEIISGQLCGSNNESYHLPSNHL